MSEEQTKQAKELEQSGKYLAFYVAEQLYCIHIDRVTEIIGVSHMTVVPSAPHYVKGIINVRGIAIPLIDVNLRLGYPEKEYTERTCIIVVSLEDECVGFIVDAVDDVIDILMSQINPLPEVNAKSSEKFLEGMAVLKEKTILVMSSDEVIGVGDFIDEDDE
ncbi:MAG: chemotaxis protein CheW [Christensenellaceae bacterium]|jgi:purine-binding chemotaxis protein CheW